jgi:hypothetical protein
MVYRAAGEPLGGFGISIADSPHTQVLHNTVVLSGTSGASIELRWPDTTNTLVANNLTEAPAWQRDGATGIEAGNYTAASAKMFVDASAGDLHLVSTATAAIDSGVSLVEVTTDWDRRPRPVGAGPDAGADELDVAVDWTNDGLPGEYLDVMAVIVAMPGSGTQR